MSSSRIDEVLCSSFDQLVDSMFSVTRQPGAEERQIAFRNLGDYIEIYREKKKLEHQKKALTELVQNKNRLINELGLNANRKLVALLPGAEYGPSKI